jgi:predicted acyltransferase
VDVRRGGLLLLVGLVLSIWLPINKSIWTSSYSVFTAEWATISLALFYWLIDVKGYVKWAHPFVIYGMNAIAVFVLSGVVGRLLGLIHVAGASGASMPLKQRIFEIFFLPIAAPLNASLLYALFFVWVMFMVVWLLYRRKWFFKV